jgi:hypothetical protein
MRSTLQPGLPLVHMLGRLVQRYQMTQRPRDYTEILSASVKSSWPLRDLAKFMELIQVMEKSSGVESLMAKFYLSSYT